MHVGGTDANPVTSKAGFDLLRANARQTVGVAGIKGTEVGEVAYGRQIARTQIN
jgi:hypothetical protein